MLLKDIIKGLKILKVSGNLDIEIDHVSANSKNKASDSLFIAVKGLKHDGHSFIGEAVKNGSKAVIASSFNDHLDSGITQVLVADTREAMALIARNYFKSPSSHLGLAGITGTNGKTTTAYLVRSILRSYGMKVSMITTVESFIEQEKVTFSRTTPESIELNSFFDISLKKGTDISVMEVSSHAIDRHRVDYLDFDCFAYTNLSQDHLDYHGTMQVYFEAKSKLFDPAYRHLYKGRKAVINIDDDHGKRLIGMTDLDVLSYSLIDKNADLYAFDITNTIKGIIAKVKTPRSVLKIRSPLSGHFNIYNILASIGVSFSFGASDQAVKAGIEQMKGVNGRFEKIDGIKGFDVVVDYAHTPDGIKKVLENARSLLGEGSKLISVFGCGGDRDKAKRKKMGAVSARIADLTILTSDNPRSEDPISIIEMIEKGFKDADQGCYLIEPDRKKAITMALESAKKGDLVVIAGKGHEDYQEFRDKRIHFIDREIVEDWAGI